MRMTRGQFAVLGNVGRKALRLYHEEGLLVPADVNEENGYHYYDEAQLETLERIKRLRKIGLSLYEIRLILEGKAEEGPLVAGRIREAAEQLKEMKALAGKGDRPPEAAEDGLPDLRPFESIHCLYIEENVELENLGMSVGKLYEQAAREGLAAAGPHFVRYEGLREEDRFRMLTCLPVSGDSGDTLDIRESRCLHLRFTGGFSQAAQAHRILRKYAEEQGISLGDRAYEVYNRDMSLEVYYTVEEEK